jgi:hypothetical protein
MKTNVNGVRYVYNIDNFDHENGNEAKLTGQNPIYFIRCEILTIICIIK